MVENNIFKFATKELSQDAFICWLVNWINIDNEENNDIKNLAKTFIYNIVSEAKNIEGIKIEDMKKILDDNNYKVEIERQYQRKKLQDNQNFFSISIDLLLIVIDKENEDEKFAIIIEDKVNTDEHDNQIKRYKKGLCQIGKIDRQNVKDKDKNILGLKENNILTCYYKVLDECRIEEKTVNFKYTRERIKNLLENYDTVKKYQYLEEYKKYVNQIEECSNGYEKESFAEAYDKYNILDEITINNIRYFRFFKELEKENKIFDVDNQKEYSTWWGRCTIGNAPSWWCNIPIKLKFDSKGIFEKYAFIKINFKQQTGIRLKIAKEKRKATEDEIEKIKDKKLVGEIKYETNGEQIYETYVTQIYKAKKIFEKIQELETEETRKCRESKKLKIEKGQNRESAKKQPEMDIFKITNIDELEFPYLRELFERIKSDLEGKTVILEDITKESQNIETVSIK